MIPVLLCHPEICVEDGNVFYYLCVWPCAVFFFLFYLVYDLSRTCCSNTCLDAFNAASAWLALSLHFQSIMYKLLRRFRALFRCLRLCYNLTFVGMSWNFTAHHNVFVLYACVLLSHLVVYTNVYFILFFRSFRSASALFVFCYLIVQYQSRTVKLCKVISKVTLNKAI